MLMPLRGGITHGIQNPRRCLGLFGCWSFRPPQHGRVFIDWLLWRKWLPVGISSGAIQHKSNTNSISFHCNTTQNLSPFRGSVNGCVLSRGSVLRTSPPACILSCLWHYFIWNANGIDMKNPDKNLSGKMHEREVKICKNRFFTLHSSFFIFPSVRFCSAKG